MNINTLTNTAISATPQHFTEAMSQLVSTVNIVATDGPMGRYGVTVSAVCSVSAEPPLILACIHRRSPANFALRHNNVFSVNALTSEHIHLAKTFAGHPDQGLAYDFESMEWHSHSTGAPCLDDALVFFDCIVDAFYEAGSHTIFIGRVQHVQEQDIDAGVLAYSQRDYMGCQSLNGVVVQHDSAR